MGTGCPSVSVRRRHGDGAWALDAHPCVRVAHRQLQSCCPAALRMHRPSGGSQLCLSCGAQFCETTHADDTHACHAESRDGRAQPLSLTRHAPNDRIEPTAARERESGIFWLSLRGLEEAKRPSGRESERGWTERVDGCYRVRYTVQLKK
jgi:hypothetical protein